MAANPPTYNGVLAMLPRHLMDPPPQRACPQPTATLAGNVALSQSQDVSTNAVFSRVRFQYHSPQTNSTPSMSQKKVNTSATIWKSVPPNPVTVNQQSFPTLSQQVLNVVGSPNAIQSVSVSMPVHMLAEFLENRIVGGNSSNCLPGAKSATKLGINPVKPMPKPSMPSGVQITNSSVIEGSNVATSMATGTMLNSEATSIPQVVFQPNVPQRLPSQQLRPSIPTVTNFISNPVTSTRFTVPTPLRQNSSYPSTTLMQPTSTPSLNLPISPETVLSEVP